MYRIKRKFAWMLTTVSIKLPDDTTEENEIALDYYCQLQQWVNDQWEDMAGNRWYNYDDAYKSMCHLICKESEQPVTVDKFINQN